MASWQAEPARLTGAWYCYRQVATAWAPLYHAAGEPVPTQSSGRWHRQGEGYAQYAAFEPLGAWAELVRYEGIRGNVRAKEYHRRMWLLLVYEHDIADLSTFEHYHACGLDPSLAVGPHEHSQKLADELREAGFRGLISPSAALVGATNFTLFGARFEKVLLDLTGWDNPDRDVWVPAGLVAEGGPPEQLISEATFADMPHEGYRGWLRARGLAEPGGPP